MSQSERPSCVIGVHHQVADLTAPVNLNHIPGNIVSVLAERRTTEPGLRYDLFITYHDDDTPVPVHRELVRVSAERAVTIRAEWVQNVGFTQERPQATLPAALVVMSGEERPLMHLTKGSAAKLDRNLQIRNPNNLSGKAVQVYYVRPHGEEYVWLSEYQFLTHNLDKNDEGLGYYRVLASDALEAMQVVRNHFKQAVVTAAKVRPTKKRAYLQIDELEVGKIYQGFCLDEPTPKNIFEAGQTQEGVMVVRALGGCIWMDKSEMRPFVFTELELVPYEQAMAEYKKGV